MSVSREEIKEASAAATVEAATVESLLLLGEGYVLMGLHSPIVAAAAQPGQFVMVRTSQTLAPLLRRPLGILRATPPSLWLYFQVKGEGTACLAERREGMTVDILGPLGKPFPTLSGQRILLIAGGRGIVPLFFFAERQAAANTMTLLYGGKSRAEVHLLDAVAGLPLHQTLVYSEDGSIGQPGLVTSELERLVDELKIEATFSCGPEGMLRAIQRSIGSRKIAHYVSLEARMACGFGICHSCAIPAAGEAGGGYRLVCHDGPIFAMEEVQWPT